MLLQGTFEEREAVGLVVAEQRKNALTFSTKAPHKCHLVLKLTLLIQIRIVLLQPLSPTRQNHAVTVTMNKTSLQPELQYEAVKNLKLLMGLKPWSLKFHSSRVSAWAAEEARES